jgi:ethanolamine utilization protein EutP (predicted NTPase)
MTYSSENISIVYVEKNNFMYTAFIGFINDLDISDVIKELKKNSKPLSPRLMIFDTSKVGVISKNEADRISNEIMPLLDTSNLKKAAIINSDNVFGQTSIKRLRKAITATKVELFADIIEAEKWLFSVN